MTELQFDFLQRYRASGCPLPSRLSETDRALFAACKSAHYIRQTVDTDFHYGYRVSELGLSAMLDYQHQLHQQVEERTRHQAEREADRAQAVEDKKRDHRHDLKILILSALISAALDLVNAFISAHF